MGCDRRMAYNVKQIIYPTGEVHYRFYDKPIKTKTQEKYLEMDRDEVKEYEKFLQVQIAKLAEEYNRKNGVEINDYCIDEGKYEKLLKLWRANRSAGESMKRTKKAVYDYSRANEWEWFVTLTIDKKKMDRYDYEVVSKRVSKWLEKMRERHCKEMVYIGVPEQHKDGAWHFHFLMTGIEGMKLNDGGERTKDGDVIYNVGRYKYGWSTATKIKDSHKTANYIGKYITKDMCKLNAGRKRYWHSKNCQRGEIEVMNLSREEMLMLKEEIKKKASFVGKDANVQVGKFTNTISYYVTSSYRD